MDTGRLAWERAVKAKDAGRALMLTFGSPAEARKFAQVMRVARARNKSDMLKLYPELPPEAVKSEWDGLELCVAGATVTVRPVQMPEMQEVEL